uniref:Ig-like domain-containing protein n=1 Tax=Amphilophus citrinellus TaxID=61819 RepID=A0A3Q0S2A3_AMPCI
HSNVLHNGKRTQQKTIKTISHHEHLSTLVAPTIKDGPQTVSVHINKPAVLECVVSGVPPPRVTWRKHGAILAGNNPGYTFAEDGSLHIHSAQVTDTGPYLCMATNQAGTQHKRVDLQVYVPPVISSETREYLAPVDSSVTLHCQTEGSPPPSVTWHKDGHVLSETVRQRVLSSGSLQIAFIQPSDAGRYTCTAANAAGTVSLEMSLTVQSRFLNLLGSVMVKVTLTVRGEQFFVVPPFFSASIYFCNKCFAFCVI